MFAAGGFFLTSGLTPIVSLILGREGSADGEGKDVDGAGAVADIGGLCGAREGEVILREDLVTVRGEVPGAVFHVAEVAAVALQVRPREGSADGEG